MIKQLQDLLVVQERDTVLQKLQAEMVNVPKDVERENAKLKADQSSLEKVKAEFKEKELEANKLKLDRRTRQDTMEKLNVQRFETKKNDEYAALGAEVDRYANMVSELETEELGVMEQCDILSGEVDTAEKALAQRKVSVTENINNLKEKARQLVARFKEAKVERVKATEGVDPTSLALYERIFKSVGDKAVVGLSEMDICTGCNMKVVPSTVSVVHSNKEMGQCENCGRILFGI